MQVSDVVPASLDVLVNDVRSDGADLDQAVVLDENRVASQVAVDDRRRAFLVQIARTDERERK